MKNLAYLAILIVGAAMVIRNVPHAEAKTRSIPVEHRAYDSLLTSDEIAFNLKRVERDPGGAIGWRQLASAYLNEAREKESGELAQKAQSAAEKSLQIRKARNAGAAIVLANAFLEQHRFFDAEQACAEAMKFEPGADAAERTMADICFELGQYDEAVKILDRHAEWSKDPSGLALLARRHEIFGHPDESQTLLQKAVDMAESDYELPATTVAWFHVKLADHQTRYAFLSEAETNYRTALNLYPQSWKALAGMARLKAVQQDWQGVLTYGKRLEAIAPITDVMGLMEDAARVTGDSNRANLYASKVLKLNQSTIDAGLKPHTEAQMKAGHTHDRMFSQYLADHGKMLDLAQHAVTHELASRKDVYAYDNYAWVTYKWAEARKSRADMVEAKQSIDKALATGIKDPKILEHARVIEAGLAQR